VRYGRNACSQNNSSITSLISLATEKSFIYVLIFAGVITIVLRHISDSLIILQLFLSTQYWVMFKKKADQAFRTSSIYFSSSEVVRDGKQ
jgi:hypothetical protein